MNRKSILILSVFLIILCITNSVLGYSPISFNENQINNINNIYSNYSSNYKYFIYFVNKSNKGVLYCWNETEIFFVQGSLNGLPTIEASSTGDFLSVILNCDTFKIESTDTTHSKVGYHVSTSDNNIYVYSNTNVYTDYEKSSIFFQKTPLGITGVLVEETTKAEIMKQIKTMIVGFLKYLMVFLVSVIAFYKGWKFLSTQLRKS